MKTTKSFMLLLAAAVIVFAVWHNIPSRQHETEQLGGSIESVTRSSAGNESNASSFALWDVKAASERIAKQPQRAYTIMVYMNGSDLESENGAATDDLIEMLNSGVNTDDVNIVLFTGGTNRWQNDVIPSNKCMLYKISDGYLEELTALGLLNMGNPGTLAGFINFSVSNFPADKYGLIMWDHGGGSIAGYGRDEKFKDSSLTLLDIGRAFEKSALSENKLEFLGFDSCLMATVEMASVASEYVKYLVASEDTEPGAGWDYTFLSVLNNNPEMNGAEIGAAVTDYFMDYYGANTDEVLTMSVTDLSKAADVMEAMGGLMEKCSDNLLTDRLSSFRNLARRRSITKTFGEGSPRDNECDMVDIGDMAARLYDAFPDETANVISALEDAVVYNRHNSDVNLKGLSAYYIYGGKNYADYSLATYSSLNMNGLYTDYLHNFARQLTSRNISGTTRSSGKEGNILDNPDDITRVDLTVWRPVEGGDYILTGIQKCAGLNSDLRRESIDSAFPKINGQFVPLYEIGSAGNAVRYAIPALVNGSACDIIVVFSRQNPGGKILGIRREDGAVIQKGYDKFKQGDKVAFCYEQRNFTKGGARDAWYTNGEFEVNGELYLEWDKLSGSGYMYSVLLTDISNEKHYSDLY